MKKNLIIILTLLNPFVLFGQDIVNPISIKVEEWNMWNSNEYLISDTLISIKRDCTMMGLSDSYYREYVGRKIQNVKEFLDETNLDCAKSKNKYADVDDMLEYDFTINYLGNKITKHIYMVEYDEYIKLVELLNDILPEHFSIGYDYNYLHGKIKLFKF